MRVESAGLAISLVARNGTDPCQMTSRTAASNVQKTAHV